jgi:riboflavin kinase
MASRIMINDTMEQATKVTMLKQLALKGAISGAVSLSSREFGDDLGISQQSASNWILKLADEGLIERQLGARKQSIKLSLKGIEVLQKEYADLRCIFDAPDKVIIKGSVATGFGEGRYYITQKGYISQFLKKLGINPYEGTLNLKLTPAEMRSIDLLKNSKGITINGFKKGGRTFGEVKCFQATINNVNCAIVFPKRSHYKDVVEVISKVHLRRTLSLKDGDEVNLCVNL